MRKRSLFITALTTGMVIAGAMTAWATGWEQTSGGWRYVDKNGNYVTDQWEKGDDNLWRWIGSDGYMAYSTWVDDTYYIGSNGVMVTGKWSQITDSDGTYWYYFEQSGKKATNKWVTVSGSKYHLDDNGRMETGWILDDTYYCDENGVMKTGWALLKDPSDNGDDGPSTTPTTTSDDTHWYYFLSSGKKFTPDISGEANYAERRIDGTKYCFDADGKLQTGWVNFEDSDVEGISNYRFYNDDGTVRTGWYSYYPPEGLEGSYDRSVVWFYFSSDGRPKCDKDGRLSANEIVKINGKQYLFDANGNPVYGLQKVYDSATSDSWNTYYFGSYTACTIQTGKFNLEESGGDKCTYYFSTNGRGFDGIKDGYLYYKGKLQKAETGSKYQVISVESTNSAGGYKNYLVNTSGKVEKGKTNVKDSEGVSYITDATGVVASIDGYLVEYEMAGRAPSEPDFEN
jgi:glucan-binding YG repeat protein